MKSILVYLIGVIAISGIFYVYYYIALRNKTLHSFNRFYLIGATLLSLILPLVHIPIYYTSFSEQESNLFETLQRFTAGNLAVSSKPVSTGSSTSQTIAQYLLFIYAFVSSLLFIKLSLSLRKIILLRKNAEVIKTGKVRFIRTNLATAPFSFFHYIFWREDIDLASPMGQQVYRHELYHIRQRHSIDILFFELLTICCWINPFFYFAKKELRTLHEFLADEHAIDPDHKWQYAELLLQHALQTRHSIVQPFFYNQIKRRIAMITSSEKTSRTLLRKWISLPLILVSLSLFSFAYHAEHNTSASINHSFIDTIPKTRINPTGHVKEVVVIHEYSRDTMRFRSDTIVIHELRRTNREAVDDLDSGNTKPPSLWNNSGAPEPLFVVDGVIKEVSSRKSINDLIDPNQIQSVTILKGEKAIALYGERGQNGVIVITSKNAKKPVAGELL